jgi:O-antigen ligase
MPTDPESRLVPILDRLALFLGVLGAVMRWSVHASTAGAGTNLFVHLLFWVALAAWFAGRTVAGGATYRFTGLEFAFLGFTIVSLVSVLRASYRLPAIEHALRDLSFALLFVLAVNALGARTLLSLLLPALVALSVYAVLQVALLFPQVDTSKLSVEMARRAGSHRPWATFLGPNQFAGFLALLLPVLLGYTRDSRIRWPGGVALGLGILAMGLTGSLGAWVSLGIGAAAFAALAWTRERGRRAVVLAGGVTAGVVLLLALSTPLLDRVARKSFSIHVRQVYWQAAQKIIARAPLGGVGLDNFREHYFEVKPETPEESVHAHDDYLQIFAETGVFGLLGFAILLALGLRKALARVSGPPDGIPEQPRPALQATALAILAGVLAGGMFRDTSFLFVWIVTGIAWVGAQVLFRLAAPDPALPWTRIGVAAGLSAILVHMTVEFDFYEPAVAMTLVMGLALAALLRGGAAEIRLPRAVCGAAAGLLALVALPLLVWIVPRMMAADSEMELARRGGPDATRIAARAAEHNPYSAEAHELAAHAAFVEWTLLRPRAPRDPAASLECQRDEEISLYFIENAIALRPRSSPLHDRKASYHRFFRGLYLDLLKGPQARNSTFEGKSQDHLRLALFHEEKAVALYPTYAPLRYTLARLIDEDDRPAEAWGQYREAMRLHGLVEREQWSTERMKLSPLAQARCHVRLGERERAVSLLAASPAPSVDELAGEWDELMRPVIEEARKGTMSPVNPRGPR